MQIEVLGSLTAGQSVHHGTGEFRRGGHSMLLVVGRITLESGLALDLDLLVRCLPVSWSAL